MKKPFNFAFRLIQFFFWSSSCAITSYVSVFLLPKGYDNTAIGSIISLGLLISILFGPIIATIADNSKNSTLMTVMAEVFIILMVLLFPTLFIKEKNILLSILFCLSIAISYATIANVNALCFILEETGEKIRYGFGRAMGSLGYAVTSAVLGIAILRLGNNIIIISSIVVLFIMTVILLITDNNYRKVLRKANKTIKEKTVTTKEFFKNNKTLIVTLFFLATIFFFSNALNNSYMFQVVSSIGGTSEDMGLIFSIMALMEIPAMFIFDKLIEKIPLKSLMVFSAVTFLIKNAFFFSKNIAFFYIAQIFQATSFAIMMPAIVVYINSKTTKPEAVRGQAIFNTFNAVVGILASFIGGLILDNLGVRQLLYIGYAISLLGVILSIYRLKKKSV